MLYYIIVHQFQLGCQTLLLPWHFSVRFNSYPEGSGLGLVLSLFNIFSFSDWINLSGASSVITSKATVNDARYKVSRIVKLVEIVEIKVDCHFYFYYALLGLYSANFFC